MNVIADIAQHLGNIGLGTYGTDILYAYVPSKLDTGIVVLDTGGPTPDPDVPLKEFTFQVFIRAASYDAGKTKLDAVFDALHRIQNTTIGNSFFYNILALSQGGHIGRNEAGRDEFSINFQYLTR